MASLLYDDGEEYLHCEKGVAAAPAAATSASFLIENYGSWKAFKNRYDWQQSIDQKLIKKDVNDDDVWYKCVQQIRIPKGKEAYV